MNLAKLCAVTCLGTLITTSAVASADPRVGLIDKEIEFEALNQYEKGKYPGSVGARVKFHIFHTSKFTSGDEVTAVLTVDGKKAKAHKCDHRGVGTKSAGSFPMSAVKCQIDDYVKVKKGELKIDISYYSTKADKDYKNIATFKTKLDKVKDESGIKYVVPNRQREGYVLLSVGKWQSLYRSRSTRKGALVDKLHQYRVATRVTLPVDKAREFKKSKVQILCSGPADLDARASFGDRIPPKNEMATGDFSVPITGVLSLRKPGTYQCAIRSGRTKIRSFELKTEKTNTRLADDECRKSLGLPEGNLLRLAKPTGKQFEAKQKGGKKSPFLYHLSSPKACEGYFH